jgi:hypothetical protein
LSQSLIIPALLSGRGLALDHLEIQQEGRRQRVEGQVLVEAQDGGLLLLDRAQCLWAVTPEELVEHQRDEQPFEPLNREQLSARLLSEMPPGFRTHTTAHYVICYNTSAAYAEWCGALFERLYAAFLNYWGRQIDLVDPQWPLVALVFDHQRSFADYARGELGEATQSIIGYYSLRTNRVTMYDLTGVDGQLPPSRTSAQVIQRILSRPEAERTVATIIHEAAHQLAFNCGLQARYADIPLWVSEGIAIYFETPDLRRSRGWSTIGAVNQVRLQDFRRYLGTRPDNSLESLIASHERFRNSRLAPDAYAEAWALNYFLVRTRSKEYFRYMQELATKRPLFSDEPAQRLAEFRRAFGDDLQQLDEDFLRYMQGVR